MSCSKRNKQFIRLIYISVMVLPVSLLGFAQNTASSLPCDYSDPVQRTEQGQILMHLTDEFKARATHKVDISGPIKKIDIKGSVVVNLLVGPKGNVICTKVLYGHPILDKAVKDALSAWRFKPVMQQGKPVAYVGRLEFNLCNISCGEAGPSMTILK